MPLRLLVLSNGHGEDLIAHRVLRALHQHHGHPSRQQELELAVMPLVGCGQAFNAAAEEGWLQRLGPAQALPSGGFSNQSLEGLAADLAAGLAALSWRQLRLVRHWARRGDPVLAIGDLLPLALAWAGGGSYGFIGTPKSDYTWRSPPPPGWGVSPLADRYHRCKGSEWDPWEWALMGQPRCRLVVVRDRLTARGLAGQGIAARAPGNPMMDAVAPTASPAWLQGQRRLLLLPGSRRPEALRNLGALLAALPHPSAPTTVLAPIGSTPTPQEWAPLCRRHGFEPIQPPSRSQAAAAWRRNSLTLLVGPGRFALWAPWAELGLATAGTATEQLVGLGIPALSLPGRGPQFKAGFARRQSRLLGGAVQPCHSPADLTARLRKLLADADERRRLGGIGCRRMGPSGGSERIATLVLDHLLTAGP